MTPEGTARLKKLVICAWIGMLYGICANVISNANWQLILSVIVLVGGSAYLGVGRRGLELLAPLVLIVGLLGLLDILPTGQNLRDFVHHPFAAAQAIVQ